MKREVKIGIFAVTMILALWGGTRFLKGLDILSRNKDYYAAYDQVGGVQTASPVLMQGVKIGTVTAINFDPSKSDKVALQLTIRRTFRIPKDSEAKIISDGLMGDKAIEITYGTSSEILKAGDTLRSAYGTDLMATAGQEIEFLNQKIEQVTDDLSRTMANLNSLMERNADNIAGTMENLNSLSGDVSDVMAAQRKNLSAAIENLTAFTNSLSASAPQLESTLQNLDEITTQLTKEEFAAKLTQTVAALNDALAKVNDGDGSVGMLLNDSALYDSLTTASGNLAALLADVKAYPGRYVHLSVFGRDAEKAKAKADKKAAKAAKKAAKADKAE